MKRYIRSGWYTGEPSDFTTTKQGKVRSYYSNPNNWEENQTKVLELVKYCPSVKLKGVSSWKVLVSIPGEGEFCFDLWEDDASIEQQMQNFIDTVSSLGLFPYRRHAKFSDEDFAEFYSNLTSEQCDIVDNIADDLDLPDYEFCSRDQLNILFKLSVQQFKES